MGSKVQFVLYAVAVTGGVWSGMFATDAMQARSDQLRAERLARDAQCQLALKLEQMGLRLQAAFGRSGVLLAGGEPLEEAEFHCKQFVAERR